MALTTAIAALSEASWSSTLGDTMAAKFPCDGFGGTTIFYPIPNLRRRACNRGNSASVSVKRI
jgi:hypothetical protein